jgi:type IV secretory pathway TraG/TraD family ATPase VirD4
MAWVTPSRRRTLPVFDADEFAASRDTLYLLSKSRSAAAPLIAALSDTAMRAAERRAERLGGRLDPPMVVPLDEAANICRIADLPDLYSHLGSRGITPVTILQSYEQGITVWGEHGMAALWGAATKKIIGAGVDSPRLARDLATLVGQHDVPVRTLNYGDGRVSESVSLRRQDILEPAAIRALPPGTALLLATGIKPALIHLTPWYASPGAPEITEALRVAQDQIRDGAIQADPASRIFPAATFQEL